MGSTSPTADANTSFDDATLSLLCAADIEAKEPFWLWPGRFVLGELNILVGDPGGGKSSLITDMAARLSKGQAWPDALDTPVEVGETIILPAEDSASTIRLRLDNAEADPSKIHLVDGVRPAGAPDDILDPFGLEKHLNMLYDVLECMPGVKLVALDPIDAFMPSTDTHRKSEVQRALARLSRLAARHNVCVIAVMHNRKPGAGTKETKAIFRPLGSLGFVAAARSVWSLSRDPNDDDRRVLSQVKCNVGPPCDGLAFTIEGAGTLHWSADPVMGSADDLMSGRSGGGPAVKAAADWLTDFLAVGPSRQT